MRLLDRYLGEAIDVGASDVHFEPAGAAAGIVVRMRVDGRLRLLDTPPSYLVDALITRIRLLARVDLSERRLPQDGRFALGQGGSRVDIRAAFMPVYGGEKVALRLLAGDRVPLSLAALGLPAPDADMLAAALDRESGLTLVVGPTGCGKTTTLYAALERLRRPHLSLLTVEDPVERDVEGVSQIAVDEEAGRSFATALRAVLRQDPDVLMVGEIRDPESARIACNAALTGHRVLTTLHATDSREALLRLSQMGVADYLREATVGLVVAQRLLRTLCEACKSSEPVAMPEREVYREAGVAVPERLPRAGGCPHCSGEGYRGRTPAFELLECHSGDATPTPHTTPRRSLLAAALEQVAHGRTTLEEALTHCPRRRTPHAHTSDEVEGSEA